MFKSRLIVFVAALLGSFAASHQSLAADTAQTLLAASSSDNFLSPDQAFRLSGSADGPDRVRLIWAIAPGYYLYRDRVKFALPPGPVTLGAPQMPEGLVKNDPYFGKQIIYHNQLIVPVGVARPAGGALTLPLQVTYQGCAEAGLCYPPITKTVSIALPAAGGASAANRGDGGFVSQQDRLAAAVRSGNLLGVLGIFFGLGLLLSLTPCVLPMVPILSGLIAGQGKQLTTGRAFALSLTYVLGMAITYTVTGAAFAAAGKQVQALFQQTWIILVFAALFVALAASMFGWYTLQMPSFVQTRLSQASNRQRSGNFGGVAVMGALSALIVTTCVAPPLVATLTVIGQSGAIARGASALFAMSLGMGAPLLVIGTSAGRLLPKAGAWMDGVKQLFGVMMLAVAAWMLTRLVPARATLLLFAIPAAAAAVVLWRMGRGRRSRAWARVAGLAAAAYALALVVGTGMGAQDPLRPLARPAASDSDLPFRTVASVSELDSQVRSAAAAGQPVLLDFYADWCVSCKEMEHDTFRRAEVRQALQHVRLLRADVTANTPDDQALLHQFQIYGPPTIAFYDARGHEQPRYRVVGYMKPAEFLALLQQAL